MKNIGSRAAAELARKNFGRRAYAARRGKLFEVGVMPDWRLGGVSYRFIKGQGRSWSEALRNAGVNVVVDVKSIVPTTMPEEE